MLLFATAFGHRFKNTRIHMFFWLSPGPAPPYFKSFPVQDHNMDPYWPFCAPLAPVLNHPSAAAADIDCHNMTMQHMIHVNEVQ